MYSLKEGSKYEDLAIMAYLWCIADKIQQEIKPDVSNTIESLWKFGENECAMQICDVMEKMLQATDKCIQEVWSVPITEELLGTYLYFPSKRNFSLLVQSTEPNVISRISRTKISDSTYLMVAYYDQINCSARAIF